MSGVTVASTIRSISAGSVLVSASKALVASVAMCEVAVPFSGSGARSDPFVAGRNHFLQIRVGHHLWRNVTGYTRNFCRNAVGHDSPVLFLPPTRKLNFMRLRLGVT